MSYKTISIDDIPMRSEVKKFNNYWDEMRGPNGLALKARFDPLDIPEILRWTLLLERVVLPASKTIDYRYRLCGTGCVELFGFDYTGKIMGEHLTQEGYEIRVHEFQEVERSGEPLFSKTQLPIKGREYIRVCRGVFPVSTDNIKCDQIFVIFSRSR